MGVGACYPIGTSNLPQQLELGGWIASLVGVAWSMWRMDVTTWSLYPFYRRRLSAAFALGRIHHTAQSRPSPTAVGDIDVDERPYSIGYEITKFAPSDLPEVLICASANISDYGATPTGTHVSSFVFSASYIGGPLVGAVPTNQYEQAMNKRPLSRNFATLPTAMALSGAAIAPSMGRMTRSPYRMLMALANLRLGVWIPNPRRLEKFEKSLLQPKPGPQYFVREMFGRNHLDAPFIYVTDGGHYDNLGLVELLRRKCKTIWCIDASGDQEDTFDTFGEALMTADSELNVKIDVDPTTMAPTTPRSANSPWYVPIPYSKGKITYPDGGEGTIVIVKAGVPKDAPWSVRAYASDHPKFPCDPTLDQLYDSDRFDAYRELGRFSVEQAIKVCGVDQQNDPRSTASGQVGGVNHRPNSAIPLHSPAKKAPAKKALARKALAKKAPARKA